MRAGLLLPACILLSALAHVLLVAAVAVPRSATTSHGETITVDIVPADEVPDLPEVPETAPSEAPSDSVQLPAPADEAQETGSPPPPQQQQRQQPPQQQAAAPPPAQASPEKPSPEKPSSEKPWPEEPPQPDEPPPGSTLAEQAERLAAMLNLPGPNTGDGSGAEADTRAQLTPQEIAAFRAHLKSCWQLPAGISPAERLKVIVRISLKQNGALAADPALVEAGVSPNGPPLVQAAMKAIKQCQPYSMLPVAKYKEWRFLDINFSPNEMTKG